MFEDFNFWEFFFSSALGWLAFVLILFLCVQILGVCYLLIRFPPSKYRAEPPSMSAVYDVEKQMRVRFKAAEKSETPETPQTTETHVKALETPETPEITEATRMFKLTLLTTGKLKSNKK